MSKEGVSSKVEKFKVVEVCYGVGKCTGEVVLSKIKMLETLTSGNVERESVVNLVVVEGNESEVGEMAKKRREWTS